MEITRPTNAHDDHSKSTAPILDGSAQRATVSASRSYEHESQPHDLQSPQLQAQLLQVQLLQSQQHAQSQLVQAQPLQSLQPQPSPLASTILNGAWMRLLDASAIHAMSAHSTHRASW